MNEQLYLKTRVKKDRFLGPLLQFLHKVGIKPNSLSYSGVVLALVAYYISDQYLGWAILLVVVAKLFDLLDGPLARYKQQPPAKGATIDIICDQIVFLLTFLALIKLKLVNFLLGASFLILIFGSKVLRSLYHKTFHQFEHKFKDLLLPIIITAIPYFVVIVHYFWGIKNFDILIGALAMILIVDCAVYLFKIVFK